MRNCSQTSSELSQAACTEKVAEVNPNYTGFSGLWQRCVEITDRDERPDSVACFAIDTMNPIDGSRPFSAALWAGRSTFLLALLSWTIGIIFLIPWFSFDKKRQEKMFKLSSASFFLMAVLIFSSLLIFSFAHRSYCSTWIDDSRKRTVLELQEQSWGFQIAIVSIMLAVFAGGVSLLAAFKMEISAKETQSARVVDVTPDAAAVSTAAPSTSTTMTLNHNLTPTIRRTPTKGDDGETNFNPAFDVGV